MASTEKLKKIFVKDSRKINKCLFPAAGYGTRFLPATKAMPKEMLPIVNKPLIQYGVEEALEAGITNMAIVTGRGKRAIEDHFDISYELENQIKGSPKESLLTDIRAVIDRCVFTYTRQIEMKGLGHAVLTGRPLIGDEPFAVILADDLCFSDNTAVLKQMVEIYEKYGVCVVAVQEVEMEDVSKYGVIKGDEVEERIFKVDYMVEKPSKEEAPSNLAVIGRYILIPEIFDILETLPPGKNGEIQLTDALLKLAEQGKVLAYKFKGRRFDCGSVSGFVEATNFFFERMKN